MSHPRSKRESVGRFTWHWTRGPTLAPKASRWAVLLCSNTHGPLSLQTRVSGPFLPYDHSHGPPSLQTRVGGPFLPYDHSHGPPSLQTRVFSFSFSAINNIIYKETLKTAQTTVYPLIGSIFYSFQRERQRGASDMYFFFFFFSFIFY